MNSAVAGRIAAGLAGAVAMMVLGVVAASAGIAVVDAHAHLIPTYRERQGYGRDFAGAADVARGEMDRHGIGLSILMPPPFVEGQPGRYDSEDLFAELGRESRRFGFLGGGGSLNLMIHQAARARKVDDDLRQAFERRAGEILRQGGLGFGELAAEHFSLRPDHPYEAAPPDHPLLLLLADIAGRQGVPIDLHMEAVAAESPLPEAIHALSAANPAVIRENLAGFERLLVHNRQAKILWAHAGWDNTGERTPALMKRLLLAHANLFMSLKLDRHGTLNSPLEQRRLRAEWLELFTAFPDRFVIGTDLKYRSPRAGPTRLPSIRWVNILADQLPAEVAVKILRQNAAGLFRLP